MESRLIERHFYPDEIRILKYAKSLAEKSLSKSVKYYYFIIAIITGISFTYFATITSIDFLVFVFGTLAVFAYSYIVFMPYEIIKLKQRLKKRIRLLTMYIESNLVRTFPIKTDKIAIAEEYEDESELYIIKLDNERVLYLWDTGYNLNKKLPCSEFEIYEKDFFILIGRQVYAKTPKIEPIIIDKKKKWEYMRTQGLCEHLKIEAIEFEKLIDKINNIA